MAARPRCRRGARKASLSLRVAAVVVLGLCSALTFIGSDENASALALAADVKTPTNNKAPLPGAAKGGKKAKPVPKGACVSQGGRFLPFASHGKRPKKSPKGKAEEITFCRVYKDSTCCTRANSDAAMLSLRMLQMAGEPSQECEELWEALECSLCHPKIGTQPGPPAVCASFCDRLFSACASAYFASDPVAKVFMPCSPRDALCSRGDEWASNSSEFCNLAGYDVVASDSFDSMQRFCFDGTLSVRQAGSAGQKGGSKRGSAAGGGSGAGPWWEQWFGEDGGAFLGGNIAWAVAGLVLTAGAAFWRWRSQRAKKKRAAVLASKQLAEARAKLQAQYIQSGSKSARAASNSKKK